MPTTRWGDKWEERFDARGKGERNGETWRVSSSGERWSRTWGEDHMAAGCGPNLPDPSCVLALHQLCSSAAAAGTCYGAMVPSLADRMVMLRYVLGWFRAGPELLTCG